MDYYLITVLSAEKPAARKGMGMRAYERLLEYVKYSTKSCEENEACPSSEGQMIFAEALAEELRRLGCEGVTLDERGYLTAALPATAGLENGTKIGFIAHMDTSPDYSGDGVCPLITENYDGGEIPLGDSGKILSPLDFPSLKELCGRTVITTDGRTLLGADDKAGIAEIMTLIERLTEENIPHGPLRFGFTPDEEIGRGADYFDVERFDADFAYTVDGGKEGEVEYENFNAASAVFEIEGVNVHPGSAKGTMINAALVATEINSMLPTAEIPALTEGYEGFYHLTDIAGDCERATLKYIVRDHSAERFEARLATLGHIKKTVSEKYPKAKITLTVTESYRNMAEKILPHFHLIENARLAAAEAGAEPREYPIRGGTDGARLSFMGLPCPNLGTGGFAFHGPFEHISAEGMDIVCNILINIVKLYSKADI